MARRGPLQRARAVLQRVRRGERVDGRGRYSQHKFRAHYNRGNCYRKLHRLHESVADLEAVRARAPPHVTAARASGRTSQAALRM